MITIEDFLIQFRKKNTKIGYKVSLTQYFNALQVTPTEYFSQERKYESDIITFLDYLEKKGLASVFVGVNPDL